MYIDLIEKHKMPLASLTYFFPEEWMKKIRYFRCYQHIGIIRNAPQTKNVRVHAEFLPCLSECLAERYANWLNTYLTYFLYDNEVMLNRNYKVFLDNFKEYDLELKQQCQPYTSNSVSIYLTSYVEIFNFYEDLVGQIGPTGTFVPETVDEQLSLRTMTSITMSVRESSLTFHSSSRSYEKIQSSVGSTVFEESNYLKTNMAANHEFLEDTTELEAMFLRKMMSSIESCNIKKDFRKITVEDEYFYYEPLTLVSLAQRWKSVLENYKFVKGFSYLRNWKTLIFEKKHNRVNYRRQHFDLNTKVCFKDFARYVFPTDPHLIEKPLKNVAANDGDNLRFGVINSIGDINYNDFVRLRSLKRSKPQGFEDFMKSELENEEGHPNNAQKHEVNILEGYNLSDSYVRLTEHKTELHISNASLRLVTNSWLYKHKELEAHLTILGNEFAFNKIFDVANQKQMKIITFNQIVIYVNFIKRKPKVSMIWPNGQIMRNLDLKQDPARKFIEFRNQNDNKIEHKRIYVSDGSVISFLLHGRATVIYRFNGLVMLTPVQTLNCEQEEEESSQSKSDSFDEEYEEESFERETFKFELEWMKRLGRLFRFDGDSFSFKPSTGNCFEVHCGEITDINHTFAKHAHREYGSDKIVEANEQGLSMTWTGPDSLIANYRIFGNLVTIRSKTDVEPSMDLELSEYYLER